LATALGLVNWNFNWSLIQTTSAATSGTIFATSIWLPFGKTIGTVRMICGTAASGTAITAGYMGLATPTNIVAQTATLGTAAASYPIGPLAGTLTAPYVTNATDSPTGLYYVLLLLNGTFGTTQPAYGRNNGNISMNQNPVTGSQVSGIQWGNVSTAATVLPTNGSALTFNATAGAGFAVGCS
jgi:hypothetical protein